MAVLRDKWQEKVESGTLVIRPQGEQMGTITIQPENQITYFPISPASTYPLINVPDQPFRMPAQPSGETVKLGPFEVIGPGSAPAQMPPSSKADEEEIRRIAMSLFALMQKRAPSAQEKEPEDAQTVLRAALDGWAGEIPARVGFALAVGTLADMLDRLQRSNPVSDRKEMRQMIATQLSSIGDLLMALFDAHH